MVGLILLGLRLSIYLCQVFYKKIIISDIKFDGDLMNLL